MVTLCVMKNDRLIRNINPFGLRMRPELKEILDREAKINGRSLNAEIVDRLTRSLETPTSTQNGYTSQQPVASYTPEITYIEQRLLDVFRRMPPEKQLALLSLFN